MAEPSIIIQNLSCLSICRTLGYGILEGDGTDRRMHQEIAVKMLTCKILYVQYNVFSY
jgi:hypothetical protein